MAGIRYNHIVEELQEINPEALTADGFEDALIGSVHRFGMEPVCLYDMNKCIEILVDRDGMSYGEAQEYFDFNVIGAWMGGGTPAFASLSVEDD